MQKYGVQVQADGIVAVTGQSSGLNSAKVQERTEGTVVHHRRDGGPPTQKIDFGKCSTELKSVLFGVHEIGDDGRVHDMGGRQEFRIDLINPPGRQTLASSILVAWDVEERWQCEKTRTGNNIDQSFV